MKRYDRDLLGYGDTPPQVAGQIRRKLLSKLLLIMKKAESDLLPMVIVNPKLSFPRLLEQRPGLTSVIGIWNRFTTMAPDAGSGGFMTVSPRKISRLLSLG